MKITVNGVLRDMTAEEEAEVQMRKAKEEKAYWSQPYGVLVDNEIRKQYNLSEELAILRQKDTKPEEWEAYNTYCEEAKARVKAKMTEVVTL